MWDPEGNPFVIEVNVKADDVVYIQRIDDGTNKLKFLVNPPENEDERLVLVDVKLTDSYTVTTTDLSTGVDFDTIESSTKSYTIRFQIFREVSSFDYDVSKYDVSK